MPSSEINISGEKHCPSTGRRILGLGVVVVDHVMTLDCHPDPDSKNEATSSDLHGGGPVPVALAQLRRFGWNPTFISRWGTDPFGRFIEDWLADEQIEFPESCCAGMSTGVSHVWIERNTGIRTSVTTRPTVDGLTALATEVDVEGVAAVHLDGWASDAALILAKRVKQQGGLVCIDTGSPKVGIEGLLSIADVVNCPKKFCEQFVSTADLIDATRQVAQIGPRIVTATNGAHGAVLRMGSDIWRGEAMQLDRVSDTNGAGDVFSAAMIHGALNQYAPEKLLRFAIAAAGLKCERPTTDRLVPDLATVLDCERPIAIECHHEMLNREG